MNEQAGVTLLDELVLLVSELVKERHPKDSLVLLLAGLGHGR